MYVCPDCGTRLDGLSCEKCDREFSCVDGVPILLSSDRRFQGVGDIAATYESIYRAQTNVWENQGRTPEFIDYFAALLSRFDCRRFLEIGCGEGRLLAALPFSEKFAVDLSTEALKKARTRTQARVSVALAERLPFPPDHFDLIASVGVMEHFLDLGEATREVARVLRPGGAYVALTHVNMTVGDRLASKVAEYIFPRPRPIRLARWLGRSLRTRLTPATNPRFVQQPIQNAYTVRSARVWFEENGLKVLDVITTRTCPDAPLMGPWVAIYISRR